MRKLHRAYDLPPSSTPSSTTRSRAESALARVPGERYPLAANDAAWPALEELRARSTDWRTGSSPTGTARSKRSAEERGRSRTAAGSRDARRLSRTKRRIDRRRRRVRRAIAWVERGDATVASVNCAPYDVAEFLARDALCAHAERRADERDAATMALRSRSFGERWASTTRKSWSRRRRSTTRARRDCSSRRRTLNPKSTEFARARRAAGRRVPRSHARPRVRAVHVVRAAARNLRAGARADRLSRAAARRACRGRNFSTGFAERRTPCSSPPRRFGKASTSSATRSRASSSTAFRFRRRAIRSSWRACARSRRAASTASSST